MLHQEDSSKGRSSYKGGRKGQEAQLAHPVRQGEQQRVVGEGPPAGAQPDPTQPKSHHRQRQPEDRGVSV